MCDYSLHDVASRPAKVGDKLVTHRFNGSSRGFAEVGKLDVAVCLLPGTEIAFDRRPEYDGAFSRLLQRLGMGRIGSMEARFRQINMHKQNAHHDALEFADGRVVLLTILHSGQHATVLQLPFKHYEAKSLTPMGRESEPV